MIGRLTLDVIDPGDDGPHRGDVRFGKKHIEWCKGKIGAGNGKHVTWNDFISWIEENGKTK